MNKYDDYTDVDYERTNSSLIYESHSDEPVSVWGWIGLFIGTGILGLIPWIGGILVLIVYLFLAFSHDINISLQNYARAVLIITLVVIILVFLIYGSVIFQYLI